MLIVDDNEVNRQVLRERLASWRMRVDEVDSAGAGLAALLAAADGSDPYGIAITDSDMPGGHGLSLARAVRADERLRRLVLILLTSVERHGGIDALCEAGFAACLVKPVRASLLMDALLTVWGVGQDDGGARLVTQDAVMAQRTDRPRDTSAGAIPARILLAEDNPVNQQVAAAMIQRLGARVDVAGNGKEVLELLALLPYDLVFMDCEMPEMDGYAATAEIRRRSIGGRRLPIVAMTAHAMQGDREQCLAAGMDDYVTKPVNPATIEAMTYRQRGHSRSDPATYRPAGELERWLERDPILQLEAALVAAGVAPERLAGVRAEAARAVATALERALAYPDPDPASRFDHVFA